MNQWSSNYNYTQYITSTIYSGTTSGSNDLTSGYAYYTLPVQEWNIATNQLNGQITPRSDAQQLSEGWDADENPL